MADLLNAVFQLVHTTAQRIDGVLFPLAIRLLRRTQLLATPLNGISTAYNSVINFYSQLWIPLHSCLSEGVLFDEFLSRSPLFV